MADYIRLRLLLHEQRGGGSWLIGRMTGSECAKAKLKVFSRGETDYELVESVIRAEGDGRVESV